MAVLTLTPSRFAASTDFSEGAYAYIVADRPVTRLGNFITPEPITLQANADGEVLSADLVPNELADEAEEFFYTVSAFDADGRRLYRFNVTMPTTDSTLFDLVSAPDSVCGPITLEDNS